MPGRQEHHNGKPAPHRSSPASPTRSPLIGREAEMRRLAAVLARVARGQGGALVLLGEAGIGKTRLAQEALSLARARGFRLLEGRAYPVEGGLAYACILRALGSFLRGLDPARQSALVTGLPDLGRLFGGLRLPTPEPLGDASLEKTRLFEAVSRLLERLAREAPIVLFLDDLHWADPASLELVHYVAHSLADQPVLVLATCNAAQMEAARGLRQSLRSLQRVGLAEELVLLRLDPAAVAGMVRQLLGSEAPRGLLELLEARAGGTPLFVEALIRALAEAGQLSREGGGWVLGANAADVLPATVRETALERLERLEVLDRRVLDLIAVSGDAAAHAVLRAASGLEEEVLLATLQHLRAAGLVVEKLDGPEVAYGITHPLVQEVAYAELSEMARRRLHATMARVLEGQSAGDLPADSGQALGRLARHYRGAGSEADRARALAVLMAAGERAREIYANDEAARHFGAALALVRATPGLAEQGVRRAPLVPLLLERLGEAWERVGEGDAAIAAWGEAIPAYESAGQILAAARLYRLLAMAEWDQVHFDTAQAHVAAGLAALAGHGPSQERIDLLHVRMTFLDRLVDTAGVAAAAAEMLNLAGELSSPRAEAEARLAQCFVCQARGEMAGARQHALEALSAAAAGDELPLAQRAHDRLAIIAVVAGDHGDARRHAERALELARRLGAPTLELLPGHRLAWVELAAGAWDDALRRSTETVALARRIGHPRAMALGLTTRAQVLALRGDVAEAAACIAEARAAFGAGSPADRHISGQLALAEASLALEGGQLSQAQAIVGTFNSSAASDSTAVSSTLLPIGLALRAEVEAAIGEAARALVTAREAAALAPRPLPGEPPRAIGTTYASVLAARAEGLARQALGEDEAARACLERAIEGFTAFDMPFERARARLEWATLTARAGDCAQSPAVAAAQESLAIFERLGARRYAQRARRLLRRLGVRPPVIRRVPPGGGPLSPRELEVARLAASGHTVVEIAARLAISPHTATTHLHHVYTRLGVGSRAALARHMVEAGLLAAEGREL